MAKIRILPEQLANQIAAGEVIERPASVVKELVENSLDARATRIEIEIEGGGTRLIRIIDNGVGMDEDDLLLCLERHGTSKIRTTEDLAHIATLGFRGEAIPSIGSVAHLSIASRPADKELGTRVQLEYGKLTKVHEAGCRFGTTCEVRNLFGNTPARRKFLRTVRTELGHIDEVVKNYALGSPSVTFIQRIDGRVVLSLDATLSLSERLARINNYGGELIPVEKTTRDTDRQVRGFLVPPEQVTIGPSRLRLFVNGRAVRDRLMVHAVTEGMRSFLMKGKNPSGLIHLLLPPEEVDVNVHPAKHEVRFRNSRDIHLLLSQAVAQALQAYQRTVQVSIFGGERVVETSAIPFPSPLSPETWNTGEADFDSDPAFPLEIKKDSGTEPATKVIFPPRPTHQDLPSNPASAEPRPSRPLTPAYPRAVSRPPQTLLATAEPLPQGSNEPAPAPSRLEPAASEAAVPGHNLMVIGQFDDLYIFCKNSEGLLVIDQHAAHERLLFERLRRQYLSGKVARQTLLFPETIELSLFQSQLVEKNGDEIERMGFSVRDFGGNTYIIAAVPALAGTINPRELFLDLLAQFGSETESGLQSDRGGLLDNILASLACKAAVKAGTALTGAEIDRLLSEMTRAELFSHCPHGRPVFKQFSRDDIKKWFYRT